MLPTSPFATPRLRSVVPGSHAATTSVAATRPSASTPTTRRDAAVARTVSSTEACSIADVTAMPGRTASVPRIARLFASVAPLVNTISRGAAPTRAATSARARSTAVRIAAPSRCALDGLPTPPSSAATIAARASGRSGALALWSR
jgi:hypothetical protein